MRLLASVLALLVVGSHRPRRSEQTSPGAGPIIVLETAKGTIEIETYPEEAPKTVAHILALIKKGFYNGLRFHRAEPGFVIQIGDPQTRDMTKQATWGTGNSGTPIGVAEITKKRRHGPGAVAMAHRGSAKDAAEPVLHHAARGTDARRQVHRLRQGDHGPGRRGQDSEGRRAQEGFGEGMSDGGSTFTSPFRSG